MERHQGTSGENAPRGADGELPRRVGVERQCHHLCGPRGNQCPDRRPVRMSTSKHPEEINVQHGLGSARILCLQRDGGKIAA